MLDDKVQIISYQAITVSNHGPKSQGAIKKTISFNLNTVVVGMICSVALVERMQ